MLCKCKLFGMANVRLYLGFSTNGPTPHRLKRWPGMASYMPETFGSLGAVRDQGLRWLGQMFRTLIDVFHCGTICDRFLMGVVHLKIS